MHSYDNLYFISRKKNLYNTNYNTDKIKHYSTTRMIPPESKRQFKEKHSFLTKFLNKIKLEMIRRNVKWIFPHAI